MCEKLRGSESVSRVYTKVELRKRLERDKKEYEKSVRRLSKSLAGREALTISDALFDWERDVRVDEVRIDVVSRALVDLERGYTKEELCAKWSASEEACRTLMVEALNTGHEESRVDVAKELTLKRYGRVAEYKTTLEVLFGFEKLA